MKVTWATDPDWGEGALYLDGYLVMDEIGPDVLGYLPQQIVDAFGVLFAQPEFDAVDFEQRIVNKIMLLDYNGDAEEQTLIFPGVLPVED